MMWQWFVSAPHPQSHMFGNLSQGWERNMLLRHGVSEPKSALVSEEVDASASS